MNFLAHAYLSFNQPEILVGNMISDFVKGKKKFEFAEKILNGIDLHRAIDNFTDTHASVKKAMQPFKPVVRLYSGAFIDIVFDHFLALDKNELSEDEWMQFSQRTYQTLFSFENILPEKFARILPYMSRQNWLFNYRYKHGIENSFEGLTRRAKYLESSKEAFIVFENEYDFLRNCYAEFFPALKLFVIKTLTIGSNV